MSKKEITSSHLSSKKLRTKELIYAGAFGALYIVLMLAIVLGTSMIPVLYLLAPITVGLVCGTVYMLCVLKVKKFGAALILGVLFALCACSNAWFGFVGAVAAALLAELIIRLGNYKSKKMYLLSFVVFNINMACPYMMLSFARDSFLKRSVEYYGQEYADGIAKLAPSWVFLPILGFALVGRFLNDKQRQQQCYMVMQDVNRQLFSDSVIEEVMLNAAVSEEEAQTILAELGLAEYADRHPASLSGGQKQRTAIAAALCAGKDIILYDEPTSGLDRTGMQRFGELLRSTRGKVKLSFIITHDPELILHCCTHVLHMDRGRVTAFYPMNEEGAQRMLYNARYRETT